MNALIGAGLRIHTRIHSGAGRRSDFRLV